MMGAPGGQPQIPSTSTAGRVLMSVGDGQSSTIWGTGSARTFQLPYTYSVQGALAVASSSINYLPPFFWPVPSGQTVNLVGVRAMVRAGSIVIQIQQNGVGVPGLSSVSVTSSPATVLCPAAAVANGDYFAPVISSVASTPDGLSLSFYFTVSA